LAWELAAGAGVVVFGVVCWRVVVLGEVLPVEPAGWTAC